MKVMVQVTPWDGFLFENVSNYNEGRDQSDGEGITMQTWQTLKGTMPTARAEGWNKSLVTLKRSRRHR